MASGASIELETKIAFGKQCGEPPIRGQQTFLLSTSQENEGRFTGINAAREKKWIVVTPGNSSPIAKDFGVTAILRNTLEGKRAARYIYCPA
jgi:hypothetical protein